MDIKNLAETLHPLERKVLPILSKSISFEDVVKKSGLSEIETTRAIQWMQNKKIITVKEKEQYMVFLGKNGEIYRKKGLPEKRLLESIKEKKLSLSEIKEITGLDEQEINISVGTLKKKAAINIERGKELILIITHNGKDLLERGFLEEEFLKKDFPLEVDKLHDEERFSLEQLKKRREIIKIEISKIRTIYLTLLGKRLIKIKPKKDAVDSLTISMLKTGTWKKKGFRRYDIKSVVPKIFGGRRHFLNEATEYVKKIWLELGFKEMTGPLVQTSFWNFDSLFTAQDHPTRDLQDTFFVAEPEIGKIIDKKVLEHVRKTHENGWTTGSTGWQYKWSETEARKNVLRTHTTVLSARTIAALKESELPAKFFSVGKCFRNETLDWSHLFEFNQVEGIVVDPDVNFRHLLGYLKEFYKKMGYEDVRIRPAYFPYTEPSAEVDVLDPFHKEWIELGGAGIFRPEVVKPLLGKDVPVLAWGLGFARIVPMYYGIKDIRELYRNDLNQLREIKAWNR